MSTIADVVYDTEDDEGRDLFDLVGHETVENLLARLEQDIRVKLSSRHEELTEELKKMDAALEPKEADRLSWERRRYGIAGKAEGIKIAVEALGLQLSDRDVEPSG